MTRASRFLFAWRWALCSQFGPTNPTDRLVALALSLYMRSDGLGAWPSQSTLAARTGLTVRSVRDALHRLVKGKWLSRVTRKPPRGRVARGHGVDYAARLPKAVSAMYFSGNAEAASLFHGRDPFKPKRARPVKSNPEIDDPQMGNDVPTNAVEEQKTMPTRRGLPDLPVEEIEAMQRLFGNIA